MAVPTVHTHETLILDGQHFEDCEFRQCRLVYAGAAPPSFDRCRFDGCEWKFEGPAAATLAHLKVVWGAGAKALVQGLIKDITGAAGKGKERRGAPLTPPRSPDGESPSPFKGREVVKGP
ncbi:MAG: hypothetical protein ACR2FH_00225 [Caulobacteraceae bacterium]